jgi:hypothetical protein
MPAIITEQKMNLETRQIVRDIIVVFKKEKEGNFELPSDLNKGEEFYNFSTIKNPFNIELDLIVDAGVPDYDVDADYYRDEDVIVITIITNPEMNSSSLYELVGELNEIVRHELEHVKQFERGYDFPKEPRGRLNYYLQPHEIEAQKAGFRRRAKLENKDLESVIRGWFSRNITKHRLKPHQVEFLIKRLLEK